MFVCVFIERWVLRTIPIHPFNPAHTYMKKQTNNPSFINPPNPQANQSNQPNTIQVLWFGLLCGVVAFMRNSAQPGGNPFG